MQENKASDKAATDKAGTDRKTATAAHAAGKEAAPSDAALAGMTKEERRAALANMTQEERAAFHERRKTAREASDKSSGSAEGTKTGAVDGKTDGDMANQTASRPNSGGFTDQTNARLPRGGTVKVIGKDGKVESRKVELGVTNRVQMQVLSGLAEGDEVVVGLKLPPPVARAQNARPPGGMGGGMGGQSGRGR